jgi:ferredoxin
MKVTVDRNICIGNASCIGVAPETFQLDEEGKAVVLNPSGNDDQTILAAAKACPVLAISLEDENTNEKLWP